MKEVLVIGSSNTDMVVRVRDIPRPGQTVMGDGFRIFAGGKGANQAVAARRAGGNVRFIAAVGADDFGRSAVRGLKREGINIDSIQVLDGASSATTEGIASGVAMIFVSDQGENCIAVAPGANSGLLTGHLEKSEQAFRQASHLLLQLEIPMETVESAVRLAAKYAIPVILNPAPAATLSGEILNGLYCITPNELEAGELTGIAVQDGASAQKAAQALLQRGVQNVIITLGGDGAVLVNAQGMHHQAAEAVDVVDTTAAGDTFNGVLAALLAEGLSLQDSMRAAVAGATLSVQKAGASDSVPYRRDFMD